MCQEQQSLFDWKQKSYFHMRLKNMNYSRIMVDYLLSRDPIPKRYSSLVKN